MKTNNQSTCIVDPTCLITTPNGLEYPEDMGVILTDLPEVLELTTELGMVLTTTPNQKVVALCADTLEFGEVSLKEMYDRGESSTYYLAIKPSSKDTGTLQSLAILTASLYSHTFTVDTHFATIAGLVSSIGNISDSFITINIPKNRMDLVELVYSALQCIIPVSVFSVETAGSYISHTFDSNSLAEALRECGATTNLYNRRIPKVVRNSPRDIQLSYLYGIMQCPIVPVRYVSCKFGYFRENIQVLLLHLGVVSKEDDGVLVMDAHNSTLLHSMCKDPIVLPTTTQESCLSETIDHYIHGEDIPRDWESMVHYTKVNGVVWSKVVRIKKLIPRSLCAFNPTVSTLISNGMVLSFSEED